jgi:sterol desaturase/sphingolipid hydroxylase (fatty acid hydroxylase superfamily)
MASRQINIFLTLTTIVVNFALAFILLQSADWAFLINLNFAMATGNVIMVICLSRFTFIDLGAYLVHLEHKIKFLWRFHLIHHTDWVDTTSLTGIIQVKALSDLLSQQWELIVGSPMWLVFLYQTLSVIATHSIMLILQCKKMGYHFELFHRISRYA